MEIIARFGQWLVSIFTLRAGDVRTALETARLAVTLANRIEEEFEELLGRELQALQDNKQLRLDFESLKLREEECSKRLEQLEAIIRDRNGTD